MKWLTEFIQKNKQNTGWKKWLFGGFVVLGVLIAVAVYFVRAHFVGREIAKLKHERDLAKRNQKLAEVRMKTAPNIAEAARASVAAQAAMDEAQVIQWRIETLKQEYAATRKLIDKISSWEDVDALVK